MTFSSDLVEVSKHSTLLIGTGTYRSSLSFLRKNDCPSDLWYIDIYSSQMKVMEKLVYHLMYRFLMAIQDNTQASCHRKDLAVYFTENLSCLFGFPDGDIRFPQ